MTFVGNEPKSVASRPLGMVQTTMAMQVGTGPAPIAGEDDGVPGEGDVGLADTTSTTSGSDASPSRVDRGSWTSVLEGQAVLDTATDAFVGSDLSGKIAYANPAAERLFGWTAAQLVGRPVTSLISPSSRAGSPRVSTRLLARQLPRLVGQTFHLTGIRRDGTDIDLEVSLSAVGSRETRFLIATIRPAQERVELGRQLDVTRWLRAVNHAAARLAALTDREAVVHYTVTTMQRSFGMTLAEAWIIDPGAGTLVPRASRGPLPRSRPARIPVDDPTMAVARVARTHRTEYQEGSGVAGLTDQRWVDRERVRAVVLLPLVVGDQVFGVLTGYAIRPLLGEQVETLTNFAALVAATINDINRLEGERSARALAERAERQAAFLADASSALATSLDFASTMRVLGELIVPRLADWVVFHLLEAGGDGTLKRAFVLSADPDETRTAHLLARQFPISLDSLDHPIVRVIKSGETQVVNGVSADMIRAVVRDAEHAKIVDEIDARCFVSTALVSRGTPLGAMTVVRTRSGLNQDFTPDDVRLISSLAQRAAVAMDNAALFEAEGTARSAAERAAERVGRLYAVSAALSRALTPGEVGKVVMGEGITALAADDGAVAFVSADGATLRIFEAGADSDQPEHTWRTFPISANSPVAEAVRTGRSIWLESPAVWSARYPNDRSSSSVRFASRAVVPLQVESRLIGAISFSFLRERPFAAEDREFAATLARQCALALERARLYAVEQRARAEAESAESATRFLAVASARLNTSLDPIKTLRLVSEVAVPALADIAVVVVPDDSPPAFGVVASSGDLRGILLPDDTAGGDPALARLLAVIDPVPVLHSGVDRIIRTTGRTNDGIVSASGSVTSPGDDLPGLHPFGVTAVMVVPVVARSAPVAALVLMASGNRPPFVEADLHLARELALRAALAHENARLFEEQVRAKEHIHTLASERSLVLGQTADGVLSTDSDGRIQFINEAAHRLHGGVEFDMDIEAYARTYDIRTAHGDPVLDNGYALAAALRDRITTEQAEWRLTRTDGTEVFALVSAAPLVGEQGQTLGAVLTLHDVTALQQVERQKDQFIISVTHDLKTPLTSIKGWSQLLQLRADRHPGQNRDMSAIAAIVSQAETMERQLNQLLNALRLESGDFLSPTWQRVDLHDIAAQTVHLYRGTNAAHSLRLESPGPHVVVGDWDPDHLRRILDNLVSNAIKYSPDGGAIDITLRRDERHAILAVKDSGIGVPAASLSRVFGQFYRAPNASAARDNGPIEGLGLGLFSAQQIALRYGGRITVESREGEGSTFSLLLPLSIADQPVPAAISA